MVLPFHFSLRLLRCPFQPSALHSSSSRLNILSILMLVVITFAIDKRFGLIDMYKKKLEEDSREGWKKESLSTVFETTSQRFVLWSLIRATLSLLT
jgi:hypothetical protein